MKNEQAVFDFHGTAGGNAPGNNAQQKPVKLRLSYISPPPCFMNSTALASMPFCKASASESFWLAALPQRRNSHRRITANLSTPDPKTKGAGVMYK